MSHKGELGPYGASSEIELLSHLIHELESEESSGEQIDMGDGQNHRKAVDAYALAQALNALRNYEALLRNPLHELAAPVFFHICRTNKEEDSL